MQSFRMAMAPSGAFKTLRGLEKIVWFIRAWAYAPDLVPRVDVLLGVVGGGVVYSLRQDLFIIHVHNTCAAQQHIGKATN